MHDTDLTSVRRIIVSGAPFTVERYREESSEWVVTLWEQGIPVARKPITSDLRWPLTCIDWDDAWRELEIGDGYSADRLPDGRYLIIRTV